MSALTNYRQLFLIPGAGRFFVPAALARLGVAMQSLAILWAAQGATGSFALAGIATGTFAITEALLAPQVARFVDSHGQATVATFQLPVFGLAAVTLVVATSLNTPALVWLMASAVAGVSCPQIGSLAAARWRHLTDGAAQISTALALEAAVNTATFMVGPVLVTSLSATVHPAMGLVVAAGLVVVFTASLVRCRESEPPSQARGPGLVLDARLLDRALLPFPTLHLLLGIYFGGTTICLTAAALSLGVAPYAGLIAAGGGIGGLLAGFVYGASSHRIGTGPAMLLGSAGLVLFCFGLSQSHGLVSFVLLTALAGTCLSPIVIPAAVKLQQAAPASLYVQAITWTASASALGTAVAAPLIGQLVDERSAQAGYLAITGVLSLLLIVTVLLTRDRRLSPVP
ncbi:hypothetical protein ACTXKH_17565 [Brachybacterium tyrofermentans]|uniref:hypothetical protein n=1 Tax=Brachybacterium tyrofermentans TaxID=47848 RepID=UPI003F8DFFB6